MTDQTKPHPFQAKLLQAQKLPQRQVLIFGPSGVGKTSFVGSAALDPRTSPTLVLDFDGGSSSLAGLPTDVCTVAPIKTWQDYSDAYDYLLNAKHGFRSVAVDSTTETHIYAVLNIVSEAFIRGQEGRQGERQRIDDLSVEQGDYGKALNQIRRFLREFRKLPMHIFYTALTQTDSEPREGYVKKPMMFGRMADEIVGMFDVTGYLSLARVGKKGEEKVKRIMILQNEPSIRAKVKTPWGTEIPDYFEVDLDSGVTKLFDILNVPQV